MCVYPLLLRHPKAPVMSVSCVCLVWRLTARRGFSCRRPIIGNRLHSSSFTSLSLTHKSQVHTAQCCTRTADVPCRAVLCCVLCRCQVLVTDPKELEAIRQRESDITKERVQKILDAGEGLQGGRGPFTHNSICLTRRIEPSAPCTALS